MKLFSNIANLPEFMRAIFFAGLPHLARFGVNEMNPPTSGARHGFVSLVHRLGDQAVQPPTCWPVRGQR